MYMSESSKHCSPVKKGAQFNREEYIYIIYDVDCGACNLDYGVKNITC